MTYGFQPNAVYGAPMAGYQPCRNGAGTIAVILVIFLLLIICCCCFGGGFNNTRCCCNNGCV